MFLVTTGTVPPAFPKEVSWLKKRLSWEDLKRLVPPDQESSEVSSEAPASRHDSRKRGGEVLRVKLGEVTLVCRKRREELVSALNAQYGINGYELIEYPDKADLKVPKSDIAPWIGKGGSVVGALKDILCVPSVRIISLDGDANT
jgi:hypothetical protein